MSTTITIEDINVKIKNQILLNNAKIEIKKNEVTILLGNNGAGKTTLSKYIVDSLYLNKNIHCSLLSKQFKLFENIKVIDKIYFFNNMRKTPINKDSINKILISWDFLDLKFEKMRSLSGGQKQIMKLILIEIIDSDFIILDEPSIYLSEKMVKKLLEKINKWKINKWILLISHNKEINKIGDSVFLFENKKITKINANN